MRLSDFLVELLWLASSDDEEDEPARGDSSSRSVAEFEARIRSWRRLGGDEGEKNGACMTSGEEEDEDEDENGKAKGMNGNGGDGLDERPNGSKGRNIVVPAANIGSDWMVMVALPESPFGVCLVRMVVVGPNGDEPNNDRGLNMGGNTFSMSDDNELESFALNIDWLPFKLDELIIIVAPFLFRLMLGRRVELLSLEDDFNDLIRLPLKPSKSSNIWPKIGSIKEAGPRFGPAS